MEPIDVSRTRPFYATRADGWPLCPHCGEDELWSSFDWDGSDPKPPMQAWIDHGLRCYRCNWSSEAPIVGSVSSAIATMLIQQKLDAGVLFSIPVADRDRKES